MNREDIIRMAREAWLSDKEAQLITEFDEAYISCTYLQDLERFAALVASAEREACAYRAGIALLGADRALANRVDQAIRARLKD